MRVELKCALEASGGRSAMISGMQQMPLLCAGNWAILQQVYVIRLTMEMHAIAFATPHLFEQQLWSWQVVYLVNNNYHSLWVYH